MSFHSLRHSYASVLIASGLDILTISRRLGHGSPNITLDVYGHLLRDTGTEAADAIEAALTGKVHDKEQKAKYLCSAWTGYMTHRLRRLATRSPPFAGSKTNPMFDKTARYYFLGALFFFGQPQARMPATCRTLKAYMARLGLDPSVKPAWRYASRHRL